MTKRYKGHAETKILLGYPNAVRIDLVPATEVQRYELFNWLAILIAPAAVGFWTTYFTTPGDNSALLWSASAFSVLSLFFIGGAAWAARRLRSNKFIQRVVGQNQ